MVNKKTIGTNEVVTQVKNQDLVVQRRNQIVEAAVPLFVKNGFHKTTTRQIAKAVGFSVGSMYEYIACKEDILYLVCISIHDQVEKGVKKAMSTRKKGRSVLSGVVREFIMVCHRMSDQIQLMYQVTKSLPSQWKRKVLENEIHITKLVVDAVNQIVATEKLTHFTEKKSELIANNITIIGHMWTFRRWHMANIYTIEEYIDLQTEFILDSFAPKNT